MDDQQVLIREPNDLSEIARFQEICKSIDAPKSLATICKSDRINGLLAVSSEGEILGGVSYFVYPTKPTVDIGNFSC